jgi:hypothetical protein
MIFGDDVIERQRAVRNQVNHTNHLKIIVYLPFLKSSGGLRSPIIDL